ncbi:MAG: hypothetical protein AAF610_02990 [Pseudomonadota bacterium]
MKALAATVLVATAGCGLYLYISGTDQQTDARSVTQSTAAQHAVVVRDTESGELRAATAREAARYATANQRKQASYAGTVLTRADGSRSARLGAEHVIYTTVTRNEDGEWVQECGLDHDHAVHANVMPAPEVR